MSWTPISPWRLGKCQVVPFTAIPAASAAQASPFQAVLLRATADCHILTGVAGSTTASTTDTLIKANDAPLVFLLQPGEVVSVVQDTAAGSLYVTPVSH